MAITNIDYEILAPEPEKIPAAPVPPPVVQPAPVAPAPVPDNIVPMPTEKPTSVFEPEPDESEDPEIAPRLSVDQPRFKNRIDAVRGRTNPRQDDGSDDLKDLLEQAVSLLESVSTLPAVTDFSNLKQRLDNVEQVLSASANVR